MRPDILNPLFNRFTGLNKIGDKTSSCLENLLRSPYIVSLLWHKPNGLITRHPADSIKNAYDYAILKLKIIGHEKKYHTYKVYCSDDNDDEMVLTFFHGRADYLKKLLPIDEYRYISGKIEIFKGIKQISHPDYIAEKETDIPVRETIYPMCAGISKKTIRGAIASALLLLPDLGEWIDPLLLKQEKWTDFKTTLQRFHNPRDINDLEPYTKERRRLAYDELLSNQLALAILRKDLRRQKGYVFPTAAKEQDDLRKSLPFMLTAAQNRVIEEINADMAKDSRMLRLLQGDVGSGKTIVAFMAALNAIKNGFQTALMAPTDILARQHADNIRRYADIMNAKVGLISGSLSAKEKRNIQNGIASGEINIVVGTHAIFQDKINFHKLGLVIIDEQHRFGVHQRLKLSGKGNAVDMLVMSATPIPRTLALTMYGDMDLSVIDQKPANRKDTVTCAVKINRIDEVIAAVGRAVSEKKQIYWVCPLVEETEKSDLQAVTERFAFLNAVFPGYVGMVHGKMKNDDKEKSVADFSAGKTRILVATTVIEVGIDVKKASIIIIEHAERFGLSALHQLRGRVGRNDEDSSCILLYDDPLSEIAKKRIDVMRNSNDGFKIAEEDLKIRGMGDILGTKQSGIPEFRIADLNIDRDLLITAAKDAAMIVATDPHLKLERGKNLRILLYLMGQDQAVNNLSSG